MESLTQLIEGLPLSDIRAFKEVKITGISSHSKRVKPGFLFIAKKGISSDGTRFIKEAVQQGAVALLTSSYCSEFNQIPQLIHPHPHKIEASLLNRFYDFPLEKLKFIGITGTNGKTTTSYIIKHLLESAGYKAGLIGTVEWHLGNQIVPATHTTPDLSVLMDLFAQMVSSGCLYVVMEVSSHALDQNRVHGLLFHTAIFTNLTQDHLDYHTSMEKYAEAKSKLFSLIHLDGCALFNQDDPWGARVVNNFKGSRISFGLSSESATLLASHILLTPQGMEFLLTYQEQKFPVTSTLIGTFNVYNILAAIGALLWAQVPLDTVLRGVASFTNISGRLQRVSFSKSCHVFVDYAHTEDALENVLKTLSFLKSKRIITVFGCGGDRDPLKRPKMARVAEQFSDWVILTSDNPRSEDPVEIARQASLGFTRKEGLIIELDRKKAIYQALSLAEEDDIVLIAGKGHEKVQIFSHQTLPFDDVEVAQNFFFQAKN